MPDRISLNGMSERSHLDKTPNIPGSDKVVGWFGHWPRFHDAEIVDLRLGDQPLLRLRAFEMTDQTDAAGHYKLQKHCTVTFWFSDEVDFSLTSDSGTGGIAFGITFTEDGHRLKMEIEASCGIDGWIAAKTWRVDLEPTDDRESF